MVKGSSDGFIREKAYLSYPTIFQELQCLNISELSVDQLKGLGRRGIKPLEIRCDGKGGVGPGNRLQGRRAMRPANGLEAPEELCLGLRFGRGPGRGLSRRGDLSKAESGRGSGGCVRVTLEHAHQ